MTRAFRFESWRDGGAAPVLDRVSEQVREYLKQAIAVPYTSAISAHLERDRVSRVRGSELLDHVAAQGVEVDWLEHDRDPSRRAAERKVQELVDQPLHARCAAKD